MPDVTIPDHEAPSPDALEGLRMMAAFHKVEDTTIRRALITMVEALAEEYELSKAAPPS